VGLVPAVFVSVRVGKVTRTLELRSDYSRSFNDYFVEGGVALGALARFGVFIIIL